MSGWEQWLDVFDSDVADRTKKVAKSALIADNGQCCAHSSDLQVPTDLLTNYKESMKNHPTPVHINGKKFQFIHKDDGEQWVCWVSSEHRAYMVPVDIPNYHLYCFNLYEKNGKEAGNAGHIMRKKCEAEGK